MNIVHDGLGISSNDISKEESLERLAEYKVQVEMDILAIDTQILKKKINKEEQDITYDKGWYMRAAMKRKLYGKLVFVINERMSVLRKKSKDSVMHMQREFYRDKLRELCPEKFETIEEELKLVTELHQ